LDQRKTSAAGKRGIRLYCVGPDLERLPPVNAAIRQVAGFLEVMLGLEKLKRAAVLLEGHVVEFLNGDFNSRVDGACPALVKRLTSEERFGNFCRYWE
jgi:hypothetical protein